MSFQKFTKNLYAIVVVKNEIICGRFTSCANNNHVIIIFITSANDPVCDYKSTNLNRCQLVHSRIPNLLVMMILHNLQ